MNDGLISPHWYRVAKLQPCLHEQVKIHRHDYRGLIWYLLENTTTGRSHRFNPAAYQFIGLMDGKRSVQEIFDQIADQLDEFAPGQEEIIDLMSKLYEADLLKSEATANVEELFDRQSRQKSSKLKQRFSNPVALRFALWDPEDFLNRHQAKVKWIFSKRVGLLWLGLMVYTGLQAAQHWPQISQHFGFNALSPYNLLLMFVLYPPIKFIHELGHAFSAKLEGGEVHEMGINFLMFMPVPYVNVSTATHFRSRFKRILVSAAGIMVESFLAALGLLLFLAAQPGLVQSIGFNIFLIGGVSSLFFNGNPSAQIRRLLRACRCDRDPEPVSALRAILAILFPALPVWTARRRVAGKRTRRNRVVRGLQPVVTRLSPCNSMVHSVRSNRKVLLPRACCWPHG